MRGDSNVEGMSGLQLKGHMGDVKRRGTFQSPFGEVLCRPGKRRQSTKGRVYHFGIPRIPQVILMRFDVLIFLPHLMHLVSFSS